MCFRKLFLSVNVTLLFALSVSIIEDVINMVGLGC